MTTAAYNWNAMMNGAGAPGMPGIAQLGSWFQPQMTQNAQMPAGVMPISASDFDWGMTANPFAGGVNNAPTGGEATGLMGFLRGKPGVAGDGVTGWLGNGQNLSALVNGLSALSSAWLGYNQLSLAKKNLSFQQDFANKNFSNSVQSYNTSLEDRIRGRTADYEGKEQDVQKYLDKHKLGS